MLLRHLADESVGLVGPRSDNLGSSARIEVPADYESGLEGFARDLQHARFGESFDVQLLARLAIAMRREVYAAAGPLDEGYDLSLFEDADYCERVRSAGWRVICAHDTFVHRAPAMSAQRRFDSRQYNAMWDQSRERFESLWGTWERHDDRVEPAVGG